MSIIAENLDLDAIHRESTFYGYNQSILPNRATVQKTFAVANAIFSLFTIISPLKTVGTIGVRVNSFLSSLFACTDTKTNHDTLSIAIKVAKVSIVVLGFASLVASLPALLLGSIAVDAGVQFVEGCKLLHEKEYAKAAVAFINFATDALIIGAILSGVTELMITSLAISAALLLVLAAKTAHDVYKISQERKRQHQELPIFEIIDLICYSIMATVCAYSASSASSGGAVVADD
jgi:hypothetical protein